MTLFRIYYQVAGGHTHLRVFAERVRGDGPPATLGAAGTLCLRNEEFEDLRAELAPLERKSFTPRSPGARVEFVEEGG